jgi:hypothetical protein
VHRTTARSRKEPVDDAANQVTANSPFGGAVINLLTYSGFYDVALRDCGLMLGALTLARLASKFDPPGIALKL